MLDDLQKVALAILHRVTKVLTGLVILPLAMVVNIYWEQWEESEGRRKWLMAIWIAPAAAFLWFAAPWWEDF